MRLLWTAPARVDLTALVRYIANDDVDAALRVEDRIVAAVNRLSEMPSIGRLGQVRGTREMVVPRTAYLAIYRIKDGDVEVLRILHGAQQWPPRNP